MTSMSATLRALHQPGNPVILANVYDILSARAVAGLKDCKALATASYAVARTSGTEDDDMTLEANLHAVKGIAAVAHEFNKPLTVDIQDAYGPQLEEAIAALVGLGVAGVNLEDCDKSTQRMYSETEACARIRRTVAAAAAKGDAAFVVNARCDALVHGGELAEVIERGQAYLAAGAANVFVWGGSGRGGISRAEVVELVRAFGGKLNVSFKKGGLAIEELAAIGVARVSVGPALQFAAMETVAREAEKLLQALV